MDVTDGAELYGLPLDGFTARRTELVKALRGAGRREEAQRVGALRKPSVAAWTVNQLVRTQGTAIAALYAAGDALSRAHADLLGGGGDARVLREATEREREAIEVLMQAARGLLDTGGHEPSPAALDHVAQTLHAAAIDQQAREQIAGGCLVRELRHAGIGEAGDVVVAAAPASSRARAERGAAGDARPSREQAAHELDGARAAERAARRSATVAERQLRLAEDQRERAAATLAAAEQRLAGARQHAEGARLAHLNARQQLQRAQASG